MECAFIYDPNAPSGEVGFDPSDFLPEMRLLTDLRMPMVVNQDSVDLFLSASDDSSGLADMQISESADFEGVAWQTYSAIAPTMLSEGDGLKTVYVRFRDQAGNVSGASAGNLIVDTTPPTGMASVVEGVVGADAISVMVAFSATDNATGLSEVRVSALESFTNTLWKPYASQMAVPASYTGEEQPALYIQFRDEAENVSQVYSTTYLVDTVPPAVFVEVMPGNLMTRTLSILAYDGMLRKLGWMWLSNDPLMFDGVVAMPYTATVTWIFDELRVVWVQVEDSVGNISVPYPAYAAKFESKMYLPLVVKNH